MPALTTIKISITYCVNGIVLPDSLGGKKYKGFAFVEGQIVDSTLSVIHIKVMKLNLQTTDGKSYIDYYYGIGSIFKRRSRRYPF